MPTKILLTLAIMLYSFGLLCFGVAIGSTWPEWFNK